jgi:DNA-binding protein H-NS
MLVGFEQAAISVLLYLRAVAGDRAVVPIAQKVEALKKDLRSLGGDYAEDGRIAIYGRKRGRALKGRKVPVKYRDKSGNTWAGRGVQPRWLTAAIKAGAKRDDFLVDKSAGKVRKKGRSKK